MATTRSTSKSKSPTWGNKWTLKKLEAFKKYVDAYLTIMEAHKNKWGWKTLYFDGFAGSGDLKRNGGEEEIADNTGFLLNLDIEEAETEVYKGAAECVLSLPKKFDYYYFVDKNKESLERLEQKLEPFNIDNRLIFRDSDANEQIKKLAAALKKDKKLRALVLLDPFGMQINWESIELLKDTRSDVWILVPSGVIVNRLLDKKGELIYSDKLCSFFGMTEDEIRKEFYDKKVSITLFGEETRTEKISDPIRKIADLYIKRLLGVWRNVTPEPLVMRNTKNVPIFHFVFASNKQVGMKIAQDILGKD